MQGLTGVRTRMAATAALATLGFALLAPPAFAQEQPAGIKRPPLQSIAFPEGYMTVTGHAFRGSTSKLADLTGVILT